MIPGISYHQTNGSWRDLALVVALHITLLCSSPLWAQESTVRLVERVRPAVVTLKVYNSRGEPIAQGSGFFLADGRIVTNAHVNPDPAIVAARPQLESLGAGRRV
jgi:S1-C subfamily serine protease